MSRVRGRDTKPEMLVRRLTHGMGYRYRLHRRGLPGSPDLVFPSRMKVIFVHGCFWHQHEGCPRAFTPKSRAEYWKAKLDSNRERDRVTISRLDAQGWRSLVVWECEVAGEGLQQRLVRFLEDPEAQTN